MKEYLLDSLMRAMAIRILFLKKMSSNNTISKTTAHTIPANKMKSQD